MCVWKRACQVAPLQDVILRSQAKKKAEAYSRATSRAAAFKASTSAAMYYYLDAQRKQRGPVSVATIQSLVAAGALKPRSYVWRRGFTKWRPVDEIKELRTGTSSKIPQARSSAQKRFARREEEEERRRKRKQSQAAAAAAAAMERAKKTKRAMIERKRKEAARAQRAAEIRRATERLRERSRTACSKAAHVGRVASTHAAIFARKARMDVCTAVMDAAKRKKAANKRRDEIRHLRAERKRSRHSLFTETLRPSESSKATNNAEFKKSEVTAKSINDLFDHLSLRRGGGKSTKIRPEIRSPAVEVSPTVHHVERRRDTSDNQEDTKTKARREIGKEEKWFYVDATGSQRGPLSRSILEGLADANCLKLSTYVWSARVNGGTMKSWKRIRDVPFLADRIKSTLGRDDEKRNDRRDATKRTTAASEAKWFYLDSLRTRQGPVDMNTLKSMLTSGELSPRAYVWKAPMMSWKRAADALRISTEALPSTKTKNLDHVETKQASYVRKESPLRPSTVTNERPSWFCLIDKRQMGPLSTSQLLVVPQLKNSTLIWQRGMREWTRLDQTRIFAMRKTQRLLASSGVDTDTKTHASTENAVERLASIFDQAMKQMRSMNNDGVFKAK